MAKTASPASGAGKGTMLGFLAATVVAAGLGTGYGFTMTKPPTGIEAAKPDAAPPGADPHGAARGAAKPAPGGHGGDHGSATAAAALILPEYATELTPIVTSLAEPKDVWVRLETSIVFEKISAPDGDRLAREISGDILAYLRTLSLTQIQGASGLQHLREDINDRATIRAAGRLREVLIQAIIVQ